MAIEDNKPGDDNSSSNSNTNDNSNNNDDGGGDDGSSDDKKSSSDDNAKVLEEVGRLRQANKELEDYRSRTDPVVQTIWGNRDVYDTVLSAHQKRLGGDQSLDDKKDDDSSEDDDKDKKPESKKEESPKIDPVALQTRNHLFKQTVSTWEKSVGLDKLDQDKRTEVNTKVGSMLSRILDHKGEGVPVNQLLMGVSLDRLDGVLNDAYYLATKDDREAQIKKQVADEYQSGATGMIGSIASGSAGSGDIEMTGQEKLYADKMGISHKDYLASKKEISKRDGSLT